jgi:hypothetical protein
VFIRMPMMMPSMRTAFEGFWTFLRRQGWMPGLDKLAAGLAVVDVAGGAQSEVVLVVVIRSISATGGGCDFLLPAASAELRRRTVR